MSLLPSVKPFVIAGDVNSIHTLDIFLDFVCPYSAKMARVITDYLIPLFGPNGQFAGKVRIIMRPHVQPWHVGSILTHEAALAIIRVNYAQFWPISTNLFKRQEEFFDGPVSALTPVEVRRTLTDIAIGCGLTEIETENFKSLLVVKDTPNGGVGVTDDLKQTIKFSRQNGIHVSPTVLWDGLVQHEISSSWGVEEWIEFLVGRLRFDEQDA